jgi:hypothetical protein
LLTVFKKNILKIFGHIKKINSSLHCKIKMQNKKMLRSKLHIASTNWFGPAVDQSNSGACNTAS